MRRRDRHGNALDGTNIGLAPNLHGAVFDQNVGAEQRIRRLEVCLQRQAKNCSICRIDVYLSVIAGILPKNSVPVPLRDTAILYLVMRLVPGNNKAVDRYWSCRALLPVTPREFALRCSHHHRTHNRAEDSRGGQPALPWFMFLLLRRTRIHHLPAISSEERRVGKACRSRRAP